MRKFTLAISIATAALMVTACHNTAPAPKDEATTVDATEAMAPVADANTANASDANNAATEAVMANTAAVDDDKGGDPGARK